MICLKIQAECLFVFAKYSCQWYKDRLCDMPTISLCATECSSDLPNFEQDLKLPLWLTPVCQILYSGFLKYLYSFTAVGYSSQFWAPSGQFAEGLRFNISLGIEDLFTTTVVH